MLQPNAWEATRTFPSAIARYYLSACTAGSVVLFVGGRLASNVAIGTVDMWYSATNQWVVGTALLPGLAPGADCLCGHPFNGPSFGRFMGRARPL